jgi:hypothetical protein
VIGPEDLAELESTLLPSLERHHLRLLAHGLRTLQAIAGRRQGPLPDAAAIATWAERQPAIAGDPGFGSAFRTQLEGLGQQLETVAAAAGRPPLELEMGDLIAWATCSADGRLRAEPPPPPD